MCHLPNVAVGLDKASAMIHVLFQYDRQGGTFSIIDCSMGDCRDSCLTKGERESACRANADFAARVLRQNASLNKPCVVGKASRKFHEFYGFMLFP